MLKFEGNIDYDEIKAKSSSDRWQYFRYYLDVFPVGSTNWSIQERVAATLQQILINHGAEVYLVSDIHG
jgi:hypothetical protein